MEAVYSPVMVRLASFLLSHADSISGELPEVTHEEIGNTIGAVRQTVTKTLAVMRKQGLVDTGPRRIRIVDRRGIEKIIEGSKNS